MKSLQSQIQQNLSQLIQRLETKERLSSKEQKAILKQLKKTSGYFQTLHKWIEAAQKISDFGSWEHYHQKDKLFWSEETYRIFGFEPYSVAPSFELFMELVHPEDREQIEKAYDKSLNNDEPYHEVYRVQVNEETTKYVEANAVHFYDEDGTPELTIGTNQNVTERELEKKQLTESLNSRNTLLQETHHRVKNNLAVVAGMLQLQWLQEDDPEVIKSLQESTNRIKAVAGIHQQLYQSDNLENVALGDNIAALASDLISTMETDTQIRIESECDTVYLDITQTLPCSLIANEVVTNAIKHAFEEREKGHIKLHIKEDNGNKVRLSISDDGVGLPDDFEDRKGSLGMNLIETLSNQLGGEYNFSSTNQGTTFTLRFQKD
jgi:two-component sensor histidine kinase